jgi:Do/DeqQ family serine protease
LRLSRLLAPALAVLAACSDPGASRAQTGRLPEGEAQRAPASTQEMQLSFAPVVRRTAPAVVNVLTARAGPRSAYYQEYGTGGRQSRVLPTGSGVIVRPDGYIVTNNHVIEGASEVRVSLSDRRELPARVLLTDPRVDLAVLKVDVGAERLPTLSLDVREPEIGNLVLAVGNPFGVGQTVTSGIVSATERTGGSAVDPSGITRIASFIQTDAAINPGNSGGALVDMDGELIGINTAILSRSGTSSGVGFAVPAQLVRQVLETAAGGGRRVERPYLGVSAGPVTSANAAQFGLSRPQGVLIGEIEPGSPAARAGLRENDVVLSVNGTAVNEPGALTFQIATGRPGETASLQVQRGGRVETVRVPLQVRPAIPREQRTVASGSPLAGATVANLSPDVIEAFGGNVDELEGQLEGVIVTAAGEGYAGREAGFRRGDVIRDVNGRRVRTVGELQTALSGAREWRITVVRGGRVIPAVFGA